MKHYFQIANHLHLSRGDIDFSLQYDIGNKNDLLELMGRKAEDVEKYMKANKLKFDEKYDLVQIVAY